MKNKMNFRHELKYLVSDIQLQYIRQNIQNICPLDKHVGNATSYLISSLYFDDYINSAYYDNENGCTPRHKYRIRIYNNNLNYIRLERKIKQGDLIHKDMCPFPLQMLSDILNGTFTEMPLTDNTLLNDFLLEWFGKLLRPKIIVSYDRVPFVYNSGNVRITFDTNISGSTHLHTFGKDSFFPTPIMAKGQQILEVKWDSFLPDTLYNLIQQNNVQRISFSKYALCRTYLHY